MADPGAAKVDALRPVYDQWGKGNWAAQLEVYGPDMEWEWSDEFLDVSGSTRDPAGASDRLRTFMSQWEDWRAEPERFIPAGDKVAVSARSKRPGSRPTCRVGVWRSARSFAASARRSCASTWSRRTGTSSTPPSTPSSTPATS